MNKPLLDTEYVERLDADGGEGQVRTYREEPLPQRSCISCGYRDFEGNLSGETDSTHAGWNARYVSLANGHMREHPSVQVDVRVSSREKLACLGSAEQ